jgi:hypothetical protein
MSSSGIDLSKHVIQAFPPWLGLPPSYTINDWIAWQKGKLVEKRLRQDPSLVDLAIRRLLARGDSLFSADPEWLKILRTQDMEAITTILEADDDESQRLRSSTPFSRQPFVKPEEAEAIRERAYVG